jgi:ribosomal protein S12 methylthiotransferase accessory factor
VLKSTFLNGRIELLPAVYEEGAKRELDALVRLYNRNLGPITSLNLLRPELLDLSVYSAYCHHVPLPSLIRDSLLKVSPNAQPLPGGGKGIGPLRAIQGAFGEMAERLLASLDFSVLAHEIVSATHSDLERRGLEALGPADLPLFHPAQFKDPRFPFAPFEGDTVLGWIEGTSLLDGRPILVPAQLVLMYYRPQEDEPPIGYATTAGLACHPSRQEAILHGLYEVVERDALNIRWYCRLAPPRIEVDVFGAIAHSLGVDEASLRKVTPYLEVGAFDMSLDAPYPVIAVVGFDRSRQERCFLGGTGGADRKERALAQALGELGQCQTGFRFDDPFGRSPILADTELSDVVEFFDAPLYYGHAKNLPRVYWFTSNDHRIRWNAVRSLDLVPEVAWKAALSWLRQAGMRPILFDFGTGDGLAVTKIYVPELTQACPPKYPTLGHERFYGLPDRIGLSSRTLQFEDLIRDPIPFA